MPIEDHRTALFTIGYERIAIDSLLARLRSAEVKILVDVRAVPRSRKPDFSKSRLSAHLQESGIDYLMRVDWATQRPVETRLARETDQPILGFSIAICAAIQHALP